MQHDKDWLISPGRKGISRREILIRGGSGVLGLSASGLLAACGGGHSPAARAGSPATKGPLPRGGTLRVAVVGGAAADELLDPHVPTANNLQVARTLNVWSRLADFEPQGSVVGQLAESFEANDKATEWVVKLRAGVSWHDGSPFTADDVMFTFGRLLDPKNAAMSTAAASIDMIDLKRTRKVDDHTVKIVLNRPWSDLPGQLAQRYVSIVKSGSTSFKSVGDCIGTGPFKLTDYKPGASCTLTANADYWESGKPHVEGVKLIGIQESIARVNALQSGQVDAVEKLDPAQVRVLESQKLQSLVSPGGGWTPMYMDTTAAPFDDVRVRQAMRLLADREKLVKVALQGYGEVGNDLFAKGDPVYAKSIPQRSFDPEQAASLLKAAGRLDDTFVLHAAEATPAMMPSALVFQQSAKAAGVKLTVKKHPVDSFWSRVYGNETMCYSDWAWRPFLAQWVQSFSASNKQETNWSDPRAKKLFDEAAATADPAKRAEVAGEAQQILWDEGGYIIWSFGRTIDGLSAKVKGITPHIVNSLGYYRFQDAALA
jgi:peptide/nickel transport system substrate-binding protein